MSKKKSPRNNNTANTGWLQVIESTPPKYYCNVIKEELTGPCDVRTCSLWTPNRKVYCCVGAFGGMKAANSEERLQGTSVAQRDKRGTLRSAAEGKFSFYDLSHLYNLSRQRVEGYVNIGRQAIEILAPAFANIDSSGDSTNKAAVTRLGSAHLFTKTSPTSYVDPDSPDEVTRVCVCCESVIEPDDDDVVIAVLDREEVAWCSRACTRELTIDGYLVSNRYKRHYSSVALGKDTVDERSRVREITQERMDALADHARSQGYS